MLKKIISIFGVLASVGFADLKDYKIASWNLNKSMPAEYKWQHIARGLLLGRDGADILVLQGVESVPSTSRYLNTFILSYAPKTPIEEYQLYIGFRQFVFVYFLRTESDIRPINAVIISKKRAQEFIIMQSQKRTFLPLLGIRLDNSVFFNMATANQKGSNVVSIIQEVYSYFAKYPNVEWALIGEFNINPTKLQQGLEPKIQEHLSIIAPNVPTRKSGKLLDYMVSGNSSLMPYLAPIFTATLGYGAMRLGFDGVYLPIWFQVLRGRDEKIY